MLHSSKLCSLFDIVLFYVIMYDSLNKNLSVITDFYFPQAKYHRYNLKSRMGIFCLIISKISQMDHISQYIILTLLFCVKRYVGFAYSTYFSSGYLIFLGFGIECHSHTFSKNVSGRSGSKISLQVITVTPFPPDLVGAIE